MSTVNLERAQPSAEVEPGRRPATKAFAMTAMTPTGAWVIPRLTDVVDPAELRVRRSPHPSKPHRRRQQDEDRPGDVLDPAFLASDAHMPGDDVAAAEQRPATQGSDSHPTGETLWAASGPVATLEVGVPTVVELAPEAPADPPADAAAPGGGFDSYGGLSGTGGTGGIGGLTIGTLVAGAAAIVGVGVAVNQGQGSSGGDNTAHTLSIRVAAGPLASTAIVQAFDKDGHLRASGKTSDDGRVELQLEPGFSGPLLIKATGVNGAPISYIDETTGALTPWAGALRAMIVVDGNASISVTPLTELAVMKMGVTGDSAAVSADTIKSIDQAVGRLFSLSDVTAPAVTVRDAGYDARDGVSDAERYGQQLAALSGADQRTGSSAATLTSLAAAIDLVAGTMTSAGQDLLAVGRNVVTSSQGASLASLVAATAPLAATVTNSAAAAAVVASGAWADGKIDATEAAAGARVPVALPSNALVGDTVSVTLAGPAGDTSQIAQTSSHALTLDEVKQGYALVDFTLAQLVAGGDGMKLPTATFANSVGTSAPVSIGPFYVDAPPEALVILPPPSPDTIPGPKIKLAPGVDSTLNGQDRSVKMEVRYAGLQDGDMLQPMRDGLPISLPHRVTNREQQAGVATVDVPLADLGPDGLLHLGVVATNTVGTANTSNSLTISLDANAPALTVAPVAGSDLWVNQSERSLSFDLRYKDMIAGDQIHLTLKDGSAPAVDLGSTYTITGSDVLAGFVNFMASAAQLGQDGDKVITATATDTAGNVSTPVAMTVHVDTAVPAPTIAYLGAQDKYLNASDSGVDVVVSYAGMKENDLINLVEAASGHALISTPHHVSSSEAMAGSVNLNIAKSAFMADGSYNVAAVVQDEAANSGTSALLPIQLETAPQVVRIGLSGSQDTTVNSLEGGMDFDIRYSRMHEDDKIQMMLGGSSINGTLHTVSASEASAGVVHISLSAAQLGGDGTGKLVRASMTDVVGNTGTSGAITVNVDTTVPDPTISDPSSQGNTMASGSNHIQMLVSYNDLAIGDLVELYVGANRVGSAHTVVQGDVNAHAATIDLYRSDFTAGTGTYYLDAVVTDAAHNQGTSAQSHMVIIA